MAAWPIGSIRNTFARRVALVLIGPVIFIVMMNWRLIAFPLGVLWNAVEFSFRAAGESIHADLNCRSIRLLRAGLRAAWDGQFIEDHPMTNEPEPNTRAGEALKPCPFCGSPDIRHDHPNRAPRVYCSTCRVVAECPDSWNTRPLPQPSELVERPSEAIEVLGGPYRQLDMDGVIVGVSRQAIYETLTYLTQLEAQIAKLQARLEVVPGWSEDADGIACRNDTIKLQDECIAKLQADGDKLAGAATALRDDMLMRAEMRKRRNNGELVVEAGNGVWHRINEALTEWEDRA